MTTRTSATSGNWRADDADTWGLGLNNYPAAGEHVVIDTGHTVTLGESNDAGSIKLIGTLAGGGHTLTLNDGGDNEIFDHDGTITGTLNITITGTTNRLLDLAGPSGSVNNLTINASSTTFTLSGTGTHTVAGDLTLTAGTLDTGSTGIPMTVTGDVSVASGGTLDIDAASSDANYSFGSLTINSGGTVQAPSHGTITLTSYNSSNNILNVTSGGTFTHNNGTVKVTTNSSGKYFRVNNITFYNLQISNNDTGAYVRWRGTPCTISNNLTIDANSKFKPHSETQVLNVTGDVNLSGTDSFLDGNDPNNDISTEDWTFGSLTIASGATYRATSGTTTITSTSSNYSLSNSGTFTHNNGTIKIDFETPNFNADSKNKVDELYNFEVEMNRTTDEVRIEDKSGNAVTILNNLKIIKGEFSPETTTDTFTVQGLTDILANGTMNPDADHDTNKIIHNGLVTNSGTYKINDGTTVKMNGGIRNLGTITVE